MLRRDVVSGLWLPKSRRHFVNPIWKRRATYKGKEGYVDQHPKKCTKDGEEDRWLLSRVLQLLDVRGPGELLVKKKAQKRAPSTTLILEHRRKREEARTADLHL